MRMLPCALLALLLAGCGQNLGTRGANRNDDRPRMPSADRKDDKPAPPKEAPPPKKDDKAGK